MCPRTCAVLLAIALGTQAVAAPGDLDLSFNGTGYLAETSMIEPHVGALCIDASHRIVVAGSKRVSPATTSWQVVVGRVSASGSLDTGFGWRAVGTGWPSPQTPSLLCLSPSYAVTSVQVKNASDEDVRLDLLPQNGAAGTSQLLAAQGLNSDNGRIALVSPIAGRFLIGPRTGDNPTRTATLQRWDGSANPLSFQGNWFGPTGFRSEYTDAFVDANGNVFAVGRIDTANTEGRDAMVSSFNSAGILRSSFGSAGTWYFGTAGEDYAQRIAPSASAGKLYVGITEVLTTYNSNVRVLRLNSNGSIDASFGGTTGVLLAGADLGDVIEDAQGRVLIVGDNRDGAAFVRRLLPNGAPDTSFGPGGERSFAFGGLTASFDGVVIDASGRIVLAGGRDSATRGGAAIPAALIVARLLP